MMANGTHPDPETNAVAHALDARVNEFLDGYILIGFIAGTNKPIQVARCPDAKTAMALNTMIAHTVCTSAPAPNEPNEPT